MGHPPRAEPTGDISLSLLSPTLSSVEVSVAILAKVQRRKTPASSNEIDDLSSKNGRRSQCPSVRQGPVVLVFWGVDGQGGILIDCDSEFEYLPLPNVQLAPTFPDPGVDPQSSDPCKRFTSTQRLISMIGLQHSLRKSSVVRQAQPHALFGGSRVAPRIKKVGL
jgi:hypothetical protein